MRERPICQAILICLLLALGSIACATKPLDVPQAEIQRLENVQPRRILFIGNSYLYYNDSLHNHVRRLAAESGPFDYDTYRFKSATIGGARLSHHAIDTLLEPGRLGIDKPFELVILQGGSAEVLTDDNRQQFRRSAIAMSAKIRATGAEVALYMTHAYVPPHQRYAPQQIDTISRAYLSVANELNALVIPVGLAFDRAYQQRPEIQLHKSFDGTHPSLLGTYLAACVVYEAIYGIALTNAEYDYFGSVGPEDADFLRRIARETVAEFYDRD